MLALAQSYRHVSDPHLDRAVLADHLTGAPTSSSACRRHFPAAQLHRLWGAPSSPNDQNGCHALLACSSTWSLPSLIVDEPDPAAIATGQSPECASPLSI
jgi:hypothetical protein